MSEQKNLLSTEEKKAISDYVDLVKREEDRRIYEQSGEKRLVAACWTMYTAIQMVTSENLYMGNSNNLLEIAKNAMLYAGLIQKEVQDNE